MMQGAKDPIGQPGDLANMSGMVMDILRCMHVCAVQVAAAPAHAGHQWRVSAFHSNSLLHLIAWLHAL